MEGLSAGCAGKCRRIENDHIKFFALARQPRQYRYQIVRDKAMSTSPDIE
jgi:hypothetical protein